MKKNRQFSRRRRALRRVLIAAAALALVNHIFHMGLLLPIQAIRENEERMGTGRTSVVLRDRAPEMHRSHLIYLTESENVTMLSGTHLTVLGWMGGFGVPVDCSEPAPIYSGQWSMSRDKGQSLYYVFGRIDDPAVVRLEVQAQYEDWETGEAVRHTAFSWTSERQDWVEKDGRYYFLFRKYPVDWSAYPSGITPVAIGYDEEGSEIARNLDAYGASSHFG